MLIVFSFKAYGGLTRLLFDYIMFSIVIDRLADRIFLLNFAC